MTNHAKCMTIISLQMCALAEKRTIDTLIDGGPQKSGDFDYSITQCKSFTSAESHPTRYYALITMILTIDNYLLGEKISQCTGNYQIMFIISGSCKTSRILLQMDSFQVIF